MQNSSKYSRGAAQSEPIRQVSLRARLVSLFGGGLQTFGWLWMTIASVVAWVLPPKVDFSFWRYLGDTVEARGTVLSSERTGSEENDTDIYRVVSTYEDAGGRPHQDTSFMVGRRYRAGETAPVEYVAADPTVSRLVEGRKNQFPPLTILFLIFPVIGLCLIVPGLRAGIRRWRLLDGGHTACGNLAGREKLKMEINDQPVFKFTFRFEANGREYLASAQSHEPEKFDDGQPKAVLFDPRNPARNVVVNDLPGRIGLTPEGGIKPPAALQTMGTLLPPVIVLAINAACAYHLFRG